MKVSRREFLLAAPFAAGVVLQVKGVGFDRATGSSLVGSMTARDADRLSALTWDSFYPYIGTEFSFSDDNGRQVGLGLTKMMDQKPIGFESVSKSRECFSLTFSGAANAPLVQDVYRVEHFALGSFSLLITVIGATRKRVVYEAIINRLWA